MCVKCTVGLGDKLGTGDNSSTIIIVIGPPVKPGGGCEEERAHVHLYIRDTKSAACGYLCACVCVLGAQRSVGLWVYAVAAAPACGAGGGRSAACSAGCAVLAPRCATSQPFYSWWLGQV